MKAHKTTMKMTVLVAIATMAFLSMTTVAFAKQASSEMAKPYKQTAVELMKASDLAIEAVKEADEPTDGPAATDPTDGANEEHAAQQDEFEDLPAGSEGDAGDSDDEELVPVHQQADPSQEATQPPILVVTTTQSHEDTPTYIPHRDHLAFTGGPQVLYLLVGALIIATAAGILFLGRGNKQAEQQ